MNLNKIISIIDTHLVSAITGNNLEPKKPFGLATRYYENGNFFPGVVSDSGEITNCFLQDQYGVSWYHRNNTGTYVTLENNFGNKLDKVEESNAINLVIFADSKKIKVSFETLKDIFISSLPSVLSKAECESSEIFGCQIELNAHELDSQLVVREETNQDNVRVGLNHGLILVRYTIKSTYRRGCTVICDCQ